MSTRSAEQIATRQMADPHLSGINEGDPVGDTVPPWPLARPDQEFQPPVGHCEGSGQLPAADLMLAWWLPVQDRADGVTKGLACAGSTATSATPFGPNSPQRARGKAPILFRSQPTWLFAAKQGHSHKPEEQYAVIERCSPGPYLELFARRKRPGWQVWGNEVASDVEL